MAWTWYGWLACAALVLATACKNGSGPPTTTTNPGQGGCHTGPPEALYTLKVRAEDGPVPTDTSVRVKWSVGDEPIFELSDKMTWHTLDDGSNVVCDVDGEKPVPTDLEELVCELWTSGATEIEVAAMGYVSHEETIMPQEVEGCDEPVPSEHEVELSAAGGAGGAR